MKITESSLQMASSHSSQQRHEVIETLYGRADDVRQPAPAPQQARERQGAASQALADRVSLSAAGMAAQAASGPEDGAADIQDPKLKLILSMLEMWLGHRVRVFSGGAGLHQPPPAGSQVQGGSPAPAASGGGPPAAASNVISVGLATRREIYMESEQTRFAASGVVKTADGREINFQIQLSMSRSYYEESFASQMVGNWGAKTDPLVVNFSGAAAQLTDQRFAFDLNADGKMEQINFVAPGSGFLVFDRNHDGVINDGGELFGPSSGNGFAELAALDDDGNGWIDENDAAFSQLQIWSRDADGNDRLQSLAEAGVGAISLAYVATPFDIKNDSNALQGQVRSTGVFLHENGLAGTISQIDLTA